MMKGYKCVAITILLLMQLPMVPEAGSAATAACILRQLRCCGTAFQGVTECNYCVETVDVDTKYIGRPLLDTNGKRITRKAENPEGCRDICKNTPGCNYWSFVQYWKSDFKCVLKQDFVSKELDMGRKGRTSGNVCRGLPTATGPLAVIAAAGCFLVSCGACAECIAVCLPTLANIGCSYTLSQARRNGNYTTFSI